jgi:hypothetical protein
MKHITKKLLAQLNVLHVLAVLSWLVLALLGQCVEGQAGWLAYPPHIISLGGRPARQKAGGFLRLQDRLRVLWSHLRHSWPQPVLRSALLGLLWEWSGRQGPLQLLAWPWVVWQGQRVLLVGYLGLALHQAWSGLCERRVWQPIEGPVWGLGCLLCDREEPWAEVVRHQDGSYQATICGHFVVRVSNDDPFRARLLLLFLRLLEQPGSRRGSRRTRDGRTPFVRQQQAAAWFGIPQPDISRVEGYWVRGAWPELLSQCTDEILTPEVVARVVSVCATFPHWTQEQVYEHLQREGLRVSQRQVRQAMEQSGWSILRQALLRRYHWTPASFELREEWLVQELLQHVQRLQESVGLCLSGAALAHSGQCHRV